MTTTPKSIGEEGLGDSWIELPTGGTGPHSPDRVTPLPFSSGEEYLRLLKEAQRESSNQSSARVSLASSRRDTPRGSPKSPPNSPNTELNTEDDMKGVYINYWNKEGDFMHLNTNSDWIWEWSSRPDQVPPKDWKFIHPKRKTYSIRHAKVGKTSLFSKEVLYTLVLTNFLSLLIGTGVGVWLSRRGMFLTQITLD
ncbi:BCL2/adenovirus E1B 19 kDa protein-interacting protein 3 [Ctenocephalides felis]|uniref:BCL2/adenovirus E1B 19 kDa protein-interacting protein 3 n=2 Tax=Ctenocephalides felis TaxID=7515 RepID=UPI000E6E3169|nr:BCL2/adenovirus E1B 19 kDa protein-interacting protein 3 [Ctenocephalides felis]